MKAFYGSRISENMTKTPDGFLVCFNVPIARTGWYEYLPQEIGLEGQQIVKVYRSPEEVFSKQAISSFEGKIVTNGHPPDLLTPQNSELYIKGAVQNVRRSPTETDLLLADLIIYNDDLIKEIDQGKREVSCGYEFNCVDNGDGTYSQVQICGNHVAVVENGRAGDRVAIKDSKMNEILEGEKKKMNKIKIPKKQRGPITNLFAAMGVKHFAQDAEPEEIAEALDALADEREEGNDEEKNEPKKEEEKENANDEDGVAALTAKVDKLTDLVTKLLEGNKINDEKPEDAIDAMIEELAKDENTAGEEEDSVTVPVEEMDEEAEEETVKSADSAAMLTALKAMKPVIAAIKDPKERKVACDSLMAQFKKAKKTTTKGNGYQGILNAQKANSASKVQKAADSAEKNYAKIDNEYASRNPHKAKKGMN